jgi:RNA polymerase sigma factor (sigma-70 family)
LKEPKSNSDLIRLLNEGDIVAFDAIYERYCNRLYGFVFRYLKNREDAEEIVQEVFLKIWEARQKIDSYSSFDSFIFTVAYNSTITLLRKRVTEQKYLDNLKLRQEIASTPNLIDEIQFKELDERVHASVLFKKPDELSCHFIRHFKIIILSSFHFIIFLKRGNLLTPLALLSSKLFKNMITKFCDNLLLSSQIYQIKIT